MRTTRCIHRLSKPFAPLGSRTISTLAPAIVLSLAIFHGTVSGAGRLEPRQVAPAKLFSEVRPGLDRTDRLVVKFREGTRIRLRNGTLTSLDPNVDLRELEGFLTRHPEITVTRHFQRSEEAYDLAQRRGRANSGRELANLNLYYKFHLGRSSDPVGLAQSVLDEVTALRLVEIAFAEPIAELAVVLGDDSGVEAPGPDLITPDFSGMQGYLYEAPSGIDAEAAWGWPGGRGGDVKLVDVEGAWLWTHEDLPDPFFEGGVPIPDQGWRNHGTAVMGEMVGQDNGYGVIGIASDMEVGGVSIQTMSPAAAFDMAAANIDYGDMFLIELHAPGPNANGQGQFGYVPMEYWQDNFDAIQTAWANGRICVEAGGNGTQNLDDPVYLGLFDRSVRYSGAIMVGAGTPFGLQGESWTNYGSRMDLNGWGSSITTCGYGGLQGGSEEEWYTSTFGGTSGASPIVCGAVGCLQGACKWIWEITLDREVVVQILGSTGTPYTGSKNIGPRPNLAAALDMLSEGVGTIGGTVRDAVSTDPIEGARIEIVEVSKSLLSDETGAYETPLVSAMYTVRVEDFYHFSDERSVTVGDGENALHDVGLMPLPLGSLSGTVSSDQMLPLSFVRITFPGTPLPMTTTSLDGSYGLADIPEGTHAAVFGLSPGYGAAYRTFDIVGGQETQLDVTLVDAETFEADDGGYAGTSPWAHGIPTFGPPGAFSGEKLWATNLDGTYSNNVSAYLTSPVMDLSDVGLLFLSFTHWYDIEAAYDGGQVQVLDGDAWTTVEPLGGYPQAALGGLGYQSGYSGQSDGWEPAIFDLTDYISDQVQVRFWFGSDGGVVAPGWYIDDVAFETDRAASTPSAGDLQTRIVLEPARPNPFSQATEVRLSLPSASDLGVRVYNASGRVVRTLHGGAAAAGRHVLLWDGQDDRGHEMPAGAYFYKIELNGKTAGTGRLLRIR